MAISLSALLRGANRGAAAYLGGGTRGTLTREDRERAEAKARQDAEDRALMRSLEQQRVDIARDEARRGRRSVLSGPGMAPLVVDEETGEGTPVTIRGAPAPVRPYAPRAGRTPPRADPGALAERVLTIMDQRGVSEDQALAMVPGANTREVRAILSGGVSPLGTRVGSVQTGRAAPAPAQAPRTPRRYRAENPFAGE